MDIGITGSGDDIGGNKFLSVLTPAYCPGTFWPGKLKAVPSGRRGPAEFDPGPCEGHMVPVLYRRSDVFDRGRAPYHCCCLSVCREARISHPAPGTSRWSLPTHRAGLIFGRIYTRDLAVGRLVDGPNGDFRHWHAGVEGIRRANISGEGLGRRNL